ncbi:MAG: hypothetical protein AAFV53_06560 [Myxococcota bacterium]
MRALLLTLPAVVLAACGSAHSDVVEDVYPLPPPPPAPAPGPTVDGEDVRAAQMADAIAGLNARVELGDIVCDNDVDTQVQSVRYISGSRRIDNPEYRSAAESLALAQSNLAPIQQQYAEQEATVAQLEVRSTKRTAAADALQREVRQASRATRAMEDAVATLRFQVQGAQAAADEIARLNAERARLESDIQRTTRRINRLEQQARADQADTQAETTADNRARGRRRALERAVSETRAALDAARDAIKTARDEGRPAPELRTLRDTVRAAQTANTEAIAALEAFDAEQATAAASGGEGRDRNRRASTQDIDRLRRGLARTKRQLANLPTPGPRLHRQAAALMGLSRQLGQQRSEMRFAQENLDAVSARHAELRDKADATARRLAGEWETLNALSQDLSAQQEQIAAVEASMSSISPTLRKTLWAEKSFPVETWTRRCSADATVTWESAGALRTETVRASAEDTDVTHEAFAQGDVLEDPLTYARTDAERGQAIDADLVVAVQDLLTGPVADDAPTHTNW